MLWSTGEPGGEKGGLRDRVAALLADRYRVERVVGQGGMGVVFLAHDLKHDRSVALKVLRPDILAPLLTGRFLHEIKLSSSLTHPHIVPLFDSGAADGILYYVMPYLTGETLRERLNRDGRLPVPEALRLAREVLGALDYAHRQNVVHRDVKPENILLQDGHALVCDFGVARAISAAGGPGRASGRARISGHRSAVGTPDYMSPEQATAQATIDGRSDVYSLGCVLYEMLAGRPPFTGDSHEAVMGAQVTDRPPPVSQVRHDVPAAVAQSIERALAKSANDRQPDAATFARELEAVPVPARGHRWWMGVATAALVVLAGVVGLIAWPAVLGAGLDPERYVVLPFRHRGGAAPSLLNGDLCELLLSQGFRRWRDVRLSDDLAVHDALTRLGRPVNTLGDARAVARRVGAGLLVWGEIAEVGDSVRVSAVLYDVRRGATLRERQMRLRADLLDVSARFGSLADSLLLAGARGRASDTPAATGVLSAWLAYDSAHAAIARWDLPEAARTLEHAFARDSAFAQAALWRAQVGAWLGEPREVWGAIAARALAGRDALDHRDVLRAEALSAMAVGRQAEACTRFKALIARDSLDFAAWYGMGECQARDRVVERDRVSPSGWRFRGSYHTAANAYARAFRINPSAHRAFYRRVPALLYLTEPGFLRTGAPATPDTGWYAAFPALAGDTIAFTPYPFAEVVSARADRIPSTGPAAVERNRALQLDVARRWTEAFPDSPDAREAYAAILEAAGRAGPASGDPWALREVERARSLATEPAQALRLAVTETRLRLKLEDFAGARRVADSTLRATVSRDADAADQLAGLAALTGHVYRAAALARAAAVDTPRAHTGEPVIVPAAERQDAAALRAFAALGGPADSARRLHERLERYIESLRPDRRPAAHAALLDRAATLAFPDLPSLERHRATGRGNYVMDLQSATLAGDTLAVRDGLERVWSARGALRPVDVAVTGTHAEARLLLALRDTASAIRVLDGTLLALDGLRSDVLPDVAQTAALVRAMALRAELAQRAGDAATATWWAGNVVHLWGEADPPLRGVVNRMREVAGERD